MTKSQLIAGVRRLLNVDWVEDKPQLLNGYTFETTFMTDFEIADMFGEEAVRDTFKNAFNSWKDDKVFMTELVCTLNLRLWAWYEAADMLEGDAKELCISLSKCYDELWKKADAYVMDNWKGEDLTFFLNATD